MFGLEGEFLNVWKIALITDLVRYVFLYYGVLCGEA